MTWFVKAVKNTEKKKAELTTLQQLSKKLGRNTLVADTLLRLRNSGVKASPLLVYKVLAGNVHREDVVEAFLAVAGQGAPAPHRKASRLLSKQPAGFYN